MLDCVSDEKGKHPTLRQFKEFLKAEKALGHELLPAKGCDHFDPVKGCLGHEDSKTGDTLRRREAGRGRTRGKTSSVTLARDTFPSGEGFMA